MSRLAARLLVAVCFFAGASCNCGVQSPLDGGADDAGVVDAGPGDAGRLDAGPTVNAGPIDAGFSCSSCAAPENGEVLCDGRSCDFRCDPGFVNTSLHCATIRQVGLGAFASYAVMSTGEIMTWGCDFNRCTSLTVPLVPTLLFTTDGGFAFVTNNQYPACAMTNAGAVKCWGDNELGQLGNGTNVRSQLPVDVIGFSSGSAGVGAGLGSACAITPSGEVRCWGRNQLGGLGDGTTVNRSTPVVVQGLDASVLAVSGGYEHTCALMANGAVKCWGGDQEELLGVSTLPPTGTPVDVQGVPEMVAVQAGYNHTCALDTDGGVWCWGNSTLIGELEDGGLSGPGRVRGLGRIASLSVGNQSSCALEVGGAVRCWGRNFEGQLGDGTTISPRASPTTVSGLPGPAQEVIVGYVHTCALVDGGVWCWGLGSGGQLGDGRSVDSLAPVPVGFRR